jgi:lactoylglutathione lyase
MEDITALESVQLPCRKSLSFSSLYFVRIFVNNNVRKKNNTKENIIMNVKVTHIGVYTADLERMRAFYEKYFNAKSNEKYENSKGFSSYFLTFSDNVRLEIMTHTELKQREVLDKVNGISHIAFSVGDRDTVISLTQRLVDDGYKLNSPPRVTGDGYFESNVSDPDGNAIEITE